MPGFLKSIYSEKAKKFCEISTLLLSYVVPVKSKVEISQHFVTFSEYMNFIIIRKQTNKYSSVYFKDMECLGVELTYTCCFDRKRIYYTAC